MSKKKAFSGSTMTLKDFHGGSIPSDLPLPSAPGVVVRPSDRAGLDRPIPNAWGGNPTGLGRSDYHRNRPGSSGTNRGYDEKTSFFSHPAHIGRNFDEDERKPLDGISVPRRSVSDESIRAVPPSRPELTKPDSPSAGRFSQSVSANPVRFPASAPVGVNAQIMNGGQVGSSVPNAWGTRKEVVSVSEPVHSSNWSGPNAVSRFAQASALEKVSSGRWQSKPPPIVQQPDVEVIRYTDENDCTSNKVYNSFNRLDLSNESGDVEVFRGRYVEKSWINEDENVGGEKISPVYAVPKERSLSFNRDGVRPASSEGKLGGSQRPTPMDAEVVERPKIKLLPRSKPLESLESHILDYKQGYQPPLNSVHVETVNDSYGNETSSKPGSAGGEGGNRAVERPRLNLKPRSQPLEQSEAVAEKERKALFGGARPRELVLKERGVDEDVINSLDVIQSPNRAKHEQVKVEQKPEPPATQPHNNSNNNNNAPQNGKVDKPEQRSWRNDNRRNQQQQERRPEPDTWRKPSSPPPDNTGLRYGKAASAVELAQAFSRSNSSPKAGAGVQRGQGRNPVPFSRLTADTREFYSSGTPRRQINGY